MSDSDKERFTLFIHAFHCLIHFNEGHMNEIRNEIMNAARAWNGGMNVWFHFYILILS